MNAKVANLDVSGRSFVCEGGDKVTTPMFGRVRVIAAFSSAIDGCKLWGRSIA